MSDEKKSTSSVPDTMAAPPPTVGAPDEKYSTPHGYGFDPEPGYHTKGYETVRLNDRGEIEGGVKRQLKQRHMAMISLGGAIGTGLFISSGSALASGGPVGVWLGYIFMATMVYSMMVALGEMATLFPVAGGFTHYASRFVDEGLGFAVGINYWYSWAITLPTELVAAAMVISYWDEKTNPAVYITVCMVICWAINFLGARMYGETEFWFCFVKIIAIVGLILLGIILMCGGGPNHDAIGFRYWRNPGPFNYITIDNGEGIVPGSWGQFLGFWNVFVQAAFSFIGTEVIATTLGEAENPRRTVPRAIKRVFFRLAFFYVGGIFVISVLVPYDHPRLLNSNQSTAAASPFVIAIETAGIHALPSIINAVVLISAWSAGSSNIYAASRTMYALALEGKLPRIFRKCTRSGLPIWCVIATSLFGPLAYMNTGGDKATEAFNWLFALSSITGVLAWWAILLSYLRFYYGMKKQGISRDDLPYRAPFQPYFSWVGFIFFTLVLLFAGFKYLLKGNWDTSGFISMYISIPIFLVCWAGWHLVKRTKFVRLDEMDFSTGRRELDEMQALDEERYAPQSTWQKIASWIF